MIRATRLGAAAGGSAIAVGLALLAWRALAPHDPAFATTLSAEGDARASSLPLRPGARLGPGERVELAAGARAAFRLPAGEELALAGPAVLEIEAIDPRRPAELWLRRGTLTFAAPPAARAPAIVYTRHATLTARAARFEVTTDERGAVARLARGRLAADLPGARTVELAPGDRLELAPGAAPQRTRDPSPLAPD